MQLPVLVEANASGGFTAKLNSPFECKADGVTAEAALECLRRAVQVQNESGKKIVTLEYPSDIHPLQKWAGTWDDSEMLTLYRKAIAEYRHQKDLSEGIEFNHGTVHH